MYNIPHNSAGLPRAAVRHSPEGSTSAAACELGGGPGHTWQKEPESVREPGGGCGVARASSCPKSWRRGAAKEGGGGRRVTPRASL